MVVESEVERKNVGFGKRSELLGEKKGILSIMKIRMSGKKMGLSTGPQLSRTKALNSH